MTCIIGLKHKGKVYIGGDSISIIGDSSVEQWKEPKVFRKGPYIFGACGSTLIKQILKYHLQVPKQGNKEEDLKYLVTKFIPNIRKLIKHWDALDSEEYMDGDFLLAYKNEVYKVYCDFAVAASVNNVLVCGSGREVAVGALSALISDGKIIDPVKMIERTLEIVEANNNTVRRPFVVLQL